MFDNTNTSMAEYAIREDNRRVWNIRPCYQLQAVQWFSLDADGLSSVSRVSSIQISNNPDSLR